MKFLKNKKFMKRVSIVFAGTLLLGTIGQAASLTKKIDATYRDIKVSYNGQQKVVAQEPFIYNESVYLPVRAVAELVDKEVVWDAPTNSVKVTDKSGPTSELEAEVAAKNFEIAKLQGENATMEKKIKELEKAQKEEAEKEEEKGDIKNTLAYLEKHYDYEHSIEWEFKLSETSSRINVEVSFDSRYDDKRWADLTKSQRETFFKDIAKDIRVDFKDTAINGRVMDRRTDKEIGTFDYSRNDSFSYNDKSASSFTELENALKRYYTDIDGTDIPIVNIVIKGTDDNITFTLDVDLYNPRLRYEWETAWEDDHRTIRDLMIDVREEIKHDYKDATIQGFIEDLDSKNTLAKFDGRSVYK